MLAILTTTGRVLRRHWPALMAWYLAGVLVHYVTTEIAGFVGAYSATVGFLILPIAILARLVSLVAMFLVLRDGLRNLSEIAPLPESATDRRRTFLSALLGGILPFFAVYWAQGLLREDVQAYSLRALEVRTSIIAVAGANGEGPVSSEDTVLQLPISVWTVLIIVLAFVGRWAWTKWSEKLAAWLSPLAVYFEVVWVFFSVMVLGDLIDLIKAWVDSRAVMAYLETVREGVLDAVAPLRWLWEGAGVVIAEAGPVLIGPLAWLTIAGVVFGQAFEAEKVQLQSRLVARLRERVAVIPNPLVRRVKDLGDDLGARFRPIGNALLLMWRAGPLLVASYALLYVVVKALESYLAFGVTRLVGPHDYVFWAIATPLVSLVPLLLIEPLRIAVISGAYDAMLGRLRHRHRTGAAPMPDTVLAPDAVESQGSKGNRRNELPASYGLTSTQNGPSASSGTTNGTTSS